VDEGGMTFRQDTLDAGRPLWLPHPALLAFIALLWACAAAARMLG
jgi:hypothetical protein